jgi:hypothetical protein
MNHGSIAIATGMDGIPRRTGGAVRLLVVLEYVPMVLEYHGTYTCTVPNGTMV